ncbi:M23 family metallopeptidase [Ruania halotolerans]|uniref:M23 family metallopeptidase n=1 Tax=Ruania halotolerans TaxID=2897773 RepID=UPI001E3ECD11|nr:M23 family metallopeptidase [Ruania halotolerans]UFU05563.1 M23 family metallopeptidase [Ruania halotolerans]
MRRAIARWQTWWARLFVLMILTCVVLDVPRPWDLVLIIAPFLLFLVRPPACDRGPVRLAPPVRGRWVALNSPGSAVPSHGVKAYGQMYAVDLLHPSPAASVSIGWGLRARRPESYSCFGEPVFAMAPGTVVQVRDAQRDHGARNTWPLLVFMMTVEGFWRELTGVPRILGNHVIVRHEDGTYGTYAHLRRGSATVQIGRSVHAGQELAQVGNTGNTSEPHLHVQLMDRAHPAAAAGIPMEWPDLELHPDDTDPRWATGEPKRTAQPGFPPNGQVLEVRTALDA